MKKISEYQDEEALDLLADLIDPFTSLIAVKEVREAIRKKERMKGIKYAIKGNKKALIEIMALLNGVPVEEFHCNVFTLPSMALQVLNDKELLNFFVALSKEVDDSGKLSGSVMENSEGEEQKDSSDTSEQE